MGGLATELVFLDESYVWGNGKIEMMVPVGFHKDIYIVVILTFSHFSKLSLLLP